jgi:crossover junction endodeoxyribonuclease RusA
MTHAAVTEPYDGPVIVRLRFVMPRPKSAPKTRRIWPAKRPDIDKLARSCLDSITDAGLWKDDGQVVELHAAKDYPHQLFGEFPGVHVQVEQVVA